jgi:hypothetical protein
VENRCLVPFTSFSEYDTIDGKKTPVWFARFAAGAKAAEVGRGGRTHLSLNKDAPVHRGVERLNQSTVLRRRFAKVSGKPSGGLECRSTEPGGQRSRHKLDLGP